MRIKLTNSDDKTSTTKKVNAGKKTLALGKHEKNSSFSDLKVIEVQKRESILFKQLRTQYANRNKLPPNPIDGREHSIVAVQLSLIEIQKVIKPEEAKEDTQKEKEKIPGTPKPRQLDDLLRVEESTMEYYEAWHNVTTTIPVNQMLGSQSPTSPIQRLLVIGPAGIGKTTLLHYIAHQWSLGNLWSERFQALFWLPLRCLLKEDYKRNQDFSIAELLHKECLEPTAQKAVMVKELQAFLENNKAQTLLLLDGYDECAIEIEDEKSNLNAIFQELLNMGTVIMTSRPYRLNQALVKKFDRHLENRGFNNTQIQNYISDYFFETPSFASTLNQLLINQPRLQGMAHVPINLALLCGLYQEEMLSAKVAPKEMKSDILSNSTLAETLNLSSLYQQLTGYLVKRYLNERTGHDTHWVEDLTLLMDYCRDELNFLGHLAFLGLTQREILLSPKLFKRLAQEYRVQPYLTDKSLRLGFLQKAGEEDHRGETFTPHYFIHLSFQEFFAARYLTESLKHPKSHPRYQEAMQFLKTQKYEPRYGMVFRFVAGLCSQDKTQDKAVLSFWKALLSPPLDVTVINHIILMIRCLDEAGSDERIPYRKILLEEIKGIFSQHFEIIRNKDEEGTLISDLSSILHSRLLLELQHTVAPSIVLMVLNIFIAMLKDENGNVQIAAASALSQLGVKAATESVLSTLLTTLQDEDNEVRITTAMALGQLGEKAATKHLFQSLLVTTLHDEEWNVRTAAALALSQLVTKATIQPILSILMATLINKDENSNVRSAAARAIGYLGEKAANESVISTLLAILKDEDGDLGAAAAMALELLGEKAATEPVMLGLVMALKDKKYNVKKAAEEALKELVVKVTVPTSVVQVLLTTLKDKKYSDYQRFATGILGKLGEKSNTEIIFKALLETLNDKKYIRKEAIDTLGKLGVNATIELIQLALPALSATLQDDDDEFVRRATVTALGRLGEMAAIKPVILAIFAALKDKDKYVRSDAVWALSSLTDRQAAIEPTFSTLLTMIKDEEWSVRNAAIHALGQLGKKTEVTRATTEHILQALFVELKSNRSAVIRAFGELGAKAVNERVIQALLAGLKDKDVFLQRDSAWALVKLGKMSTTESVVQSLIVALNDKNRETRHGIARALLKLPLSDTLDRYLQSPIPRLLGINKQYARGMIANLLLQNAYLMYDKNQLILGDGQMHTYPLVTSDSNKLAIELVKAMHELAKFIGLPLVLTESILENREAYPIKDVADLPDAAFVPSVMKRSLSTVEPHLLLGIVRKEQAAQLAEQQQQQIRNNTHLWEYYSHFTQYLAEAWNACGTIHSGRVANAEKLKLDNVATAIEKGADAALDLLPFHIPGSGLLKSLFTSGISYYTHRQKQEAVNRIAGFFLPLEGISYIELLGRVLTLASSQTIEQTAEPYAVSRWKQLKCLGKAAKDAITVNDINTPLKELAQNHAKLILQAIIDKKLKPYPQSENLPEFVEIIRQASIKITDLSKLPPLTDLKTTATTMPRYIPATSIPPSKPPPPPPSRNSEAILQFRKKLDVLMYHDDGGFSFLIKRPAFNCLQLQCTAADKILMTSDDIRKELIELTKLFKTSITDLGIRTEQYKIEPNWKDWTLTITADLPILNKIGEILHHAGAKYFQSAIQAKAILFGTAVDRPLSTTGTAPKEHQSIATCILQ